MGIQWRKRGRESSFLLSSLLLWPWGQMISVLTNMCLWNSDFTALALQEDRRLEKFSVYPSCSEGRGLLLPAQSWNACLLTVVWSTEPFKGKVQKRQGEEYSRPGSLGHLFRTCPCCTLSLYGCMTGWHLMDRSSDLVLFTCYPSDFQGILMKKCFGEDREGYKFPSYGNNWETSKVNLHEHRAPRLSTTDFSLFPTGSKSPHSLLHADYLINLVETTKKF